jgi:Ca-activated chloride channel homolog
MRRLPYSFLPCVAASMCVLVGCSAGEGGVGEEAAVYAPPPPPVEASQPPTCESLETSKPLVLYLSSDDSNSMASPARAREALAVDGPSWPELRTHEFLNYFRIEYPTPDGTLGIHNDAREGATPGEYALQIGVRAPNIARRPMTLTFSVDTSGSMAEGGTERARAAMLALASQLRKGDVVNVVTWSTEQNVVLDNHVATGPSDSTVIDAANGLGSDGSTDLHAGLVEGYKLAEQTYDPSRLNRLILISDGGANAGVTDVDLIAEKSQLGDDEGIYLVGIGTGPAEYYSDELMDIVTDAGRGAYVYLDTPEEAVHILADRFDEVMEVAARGVEVELSLPWYFQIERFYGEEYSTDRTEVKPQHLAPGDAMVFLQTLKACDPSVVAPEDPINVTVSWQEPITHEARSVSAQTSLSTLLAGDHAAIDKGLAIVAFAEALKTHAPADPAFAEARRLIKIADPRGVDPELLEVRALIDIADARRD